MKQKPRIYYTESQKALMWERWKQGDSLQMIAQLFDRNHSSIQRILAESGGIRPAPRCRSRLALLWQPDLTTWPSMSLTPRNYKAERLQWGDNGVSGQTMMFSQRQHAMLARPAENGQKQSLPSSRKCLAM